MGISRHGLRLVGPQWPGAELMQQELQCPETWGSDPHPTRTRPEKQGTSRAGQEAWERDCVKSLSGCL